MAHKKYYNSLNEIVPSVTTLISNNLGWNKQMLIAWSKKIALKEGRDSNEITEYAANIGTLTHYLIECKLKKETPDITPYKKEDLVIARNGYLGFCEWEKFWKPADYTYSEVELVSDKHNFGGTIDIIAKKNNKYHILDIKTSNHIHAEMVIQLAAYKKMAEEKLSIKIETCNIIKISKDECKYLFFPMTQEEIDAGWLVFESLLKIEKNKKILQSFGK